MKILSWRLDRKLVRNANNAQKVQERIFWKIIEDFKYTGIGKVFSIDRVISIEDFNNKVPLTVDVDYLDFIEKVTQNNKSGEFQKGTLSYLAKTSGSTAKSKYIPYTENLIKNFKRFSTNIILKFSSIVGHYDFLDAYILVSPANPNTETNEHGITIGYGTGIMTLLAPKIVKNMVRPSAHILELPTTAQKIKEMVKEAIDLDIRSFSSNPSFAIPILEELYAEAKRQNKKADTLTDLWPNLRAYSYSGSSIKPYLERLRQLTGPDLPYLEVYSATETPIAFQYEKNVEGMYLDLESAFFQFQMITEGIESKRYLVNELKVGTHYRIIMTTFGGLFSYRIGDIVEFTSINPPLLKVIGREKEELNMTGGDQFPLPLIHKFLKEVYKEFKVSPKLFFVCPHFVGFNKGYHWCFEVDEHDRNFDGNKLLEYLDTKLKLYSAGYGLGRDSNSRLIEPKLSLIPCGTINKYIMESKQFGQGKFLSVHNTHEDSDRFFDFVKKNNIIIESY